MAAKVNTRFLIILATVLIALAGAVAFLGMRAMRKSGDDYLKLGDQAAAAGNWAGAADFYGTAVNKDQRNIAWIKKWIDAIRKQVPATRQQYLDQYERQYLLSIAGLSQADPASYDSQKEYLEEWHKRVRRSSSDLASWEALISASEDVLGRFTGDQKSRDLLTRYRALGRANVLVIKPAWTPEELAQARADLATAFAADPKDEDLVLAEVGLDALEAQKLRDAQEGSKADEVLRNARKRLEAFVAAAPPGAAARFRQLQLEFAELGRTAPPGTTVRELLAQTTEQFKSVVAAYEAVPAKDVDGRQLISLMLSGADGVEGQGAKVRAMLEAAAAAQPEDSAFLVSYGEYLLTAGEVDKSVEVWERVVKMPVPPLSLAGIDLYENKARAVSSQAEAMFAAWQRSRDLAERQAFAQRAKGYRDALVTLTNEDLPRVSALDARLKYIAGDTSGARALISKYNEQTGRRDPQSVLFEGEIMRALGNRGAAEAAYKRVLEIQPRSILAMRALGQMAMEAENYPEALAHISSAAVLLPTDPDLAQQAKMLKDIVEGKDPVIISLSRANEMLRGVKPDPAAAEQVLSKAMKDSGGDPRVATVYGELLFGRGKRDEALVVIRTGLATSPDFPPLKALERRMTSGGDPFEAELAQIDGAILPDVQKFTRKYIAASRVGKPERALEFLKEAAKLAPADPTVAEYQFIEAIRAGDMKEADRLVKLAEENNLDSLGGVVFRARRDIAEAQRLRREAAEREKAGDAVEAGRMRAKALDGLKNTRLILKQITQSDKTNVAGWRLLGAIENELGDAGAAVEAFSTAVGMRPDDLPSINGYLRALSSTGAVDRALDFARKSQQAAGRDEEFRQVWLALESTAPSGNRERALEVRRSIAAAEPENLQNLYALIYLLFDQRKFEEAVTEIDRVSRAGQPADATALTAEMYMRKGELEAAAQTYVAYIDAATEPSEKFRMSMQAARQMRNAGQPQAALVFFGKALPLQDKVLQEADREIADTLYSAGNPGEAVERYKTILQNGFTDENDLVSARIVEGYLMQQKFAEAAEALGKLGPKLERNATLMVLAARTAVAQNDRVKARRLLDQAVALDPKNPTVFVARGDFNLGDPTMVRDVEQDFEQALRLAPAFSVARTRLASIYLSQGNVDASVAQLRQGVAADPGNDDLRVFFINSLLEFNRQDEAATVVEETIKSRPQDAVWLMRGSQLMGSIGRRERAIELAAQAFERNKDMFSANVYVKALMSAEPARTQDALRVLATPELSAEKAPLLRVLRARVYLKSNQPEKALADMQGAAGLLDTSVPARVKEYFDLAAEIYESPRDRALLVQRLEDLKPLEGWVKYFGSTLRLAEPSTRERAEKDLRDLAANDKDAQIQYSAWSSLGQRLYIEKRYEDALACYRKGLEIAPEDPGMNNNTAYTLAVDLGRPAEALPFAEKAAKASPESPIVLDTLGAVYLETGKLAEAEVALTRAMARAGSPEQRLPVMVHMGLLRVKQGDPTRARQIMDELKKAEEANPALFAQIGPAYERLKEGVRP